MPPVRVPVMCSTVWAIIVRVMKMPVVMMMRARMRMMMRGSSMKVMRCRVGIMVTLDI